MMSDWLREVEHAGYNSVQYAGPDSEQAPLLPNPAREARCVRIFWIVFLSSLFCTGLIIGCYLIVEEDHDYPISGPYTLYNKGGWRGLSSNGPLKRYQYLPNHVLILQTSTENCDNMNDCSQIIRELQNDHVSKNLTDIAYNFIVAGDGATYEGRGWQFQPQLADVVCNKTLVVAFLGNFENNLPSASQIMESKVLLKEGILRGNLDLCFTISLYKEKPQDGGGQLVHVFNRLVMENNRRKYSLNC